MKLWRKILADAARECAQNGMCATQTASHMGMAYPTLVKLAKEAGIEFKHGRPGRRSGPREERIREIALAWRGKASASEIAEAIGDGVTKNVIIGHWYRARHSGQIEAAE